MVRRQSRYEEESSYGESDNPFLRQQRITRERMRAERERRYRFPVRNEEEDGSVLFEEKALNDLCENVEEKIPCSPKRNDDASVLANTRKSSSYLAKGGRAQRYDSSYGRYDTSDYDMESQMDPSNMKGYYLASGKSREMQTIEGKTAGDFAMVGNNSPSNVLSYMFGGFGMCPPDPAGMNADSQVQQVTMVGQVANLCFPDKKGLAADEQVATNEWQHEEKKEDLRIVGAAGARNTSFRRELHETNIMDQFDEEKQEPTIPTFMKEEEEDAPFCETPCSPRNVPEEPTDDAAPFCEPPCSPRNKADKDPTLSSSVFLPNLDGTDNNLLDDEATESKLEEIRRKKRVIEEQLRNSQADPDYHTKTKTKESSGLSKGRNISLIIFLFILFGGAVALVTIGFFWPKLMP